MMILAVKRVRLVVSALTNALAIGLAPILLKIVEIGVKGSRPSWRTIFERREMTSVRLASLSEMPAIL